MQSWVYRVCVAFAVASARSVPLATDLGRAFGSITSYTLPVEASWTQYTRFIYAAMISGGFRSRMKIRTNSFGVLALDSTATSAVRRCCVSSFVRRNVSNPDPSRTKP
ncbi:hypothetical protein MPH_08870 [Macrophomina phaseolina MS6]|uniref:Secreted protein n=2 Tax=Macrophomina phaseolina TaxID=35725 RepID=K2QW61_MACPH|nr:hypothetical protein MPH_08870 [Macrophomina phaseolina MS6]KAH7052232.1 hypothetical protein B0J12DRAFT_660927 [Macrophomina phaseolina]